MPGEALTKVAHQDLAKLDTGAMSVAIATWADATTDAGSLRRRDLLRDKCKVLTDFFAFTGKRPDQIKPVDVKAWQMELESRGLAASTIYAMVSRISSFYTWARKDPRLAEVLNHNPTSLARPKAPRQYQSESTKGLSDSHLLAILHEVKSDADSGSVVGKRDYAILLHFILTGRRRQEVIGLRWGDVQIFGAMVVTYRVKGGRKEVRVVEDPRVKESMLDYLRSSDRLESMMDESPLWTRHDRAGIPGRALTSHAFAKRFKVYAKRAGIGEVHLHQLRHSFARMAGDVSGSIGEVQEALGHQSQSTTRIYLERVGVRKDMFSENIVTRLGIGD